MTGIKAQVRDGVLTVRDGERDQVLPVGGDAWVCWLEQPGSTAFRFEHETAHFTARRELQRGRWYWYAYRKQRGRLRKAYLGRSNNLALERLLEAGRRLAESDDAPAAPTIRAVTAAEASTPVVQHNLPAPVSSFLGRESAIAELRCLLATTRLLTLAGSGGVGKTQLALHLAAGGLGTTADSAWLAELTSLTDPVLVPEAIAKTLGLREEAGRPLTARLGTALGTGRTLLVLDNCEHLVDGCAALAVDLLRSCPNLHILATSRQPLGVPGETVWRVPSLDLPPSEASLECRAQSAAIQLFVDRARAVRADFTLTNQNAPAVAEICRRLDGIPLAIELAAARARILAPGEIAVRLGDRFRLLGGGSRAAPWRQQTLRATVDWSYDLLAEEERRLFERLAVFAGGFTLEAAEAVCAGGGIEMAEILDILSRLEDRSLVLVEPQAGHEPTRYRLHETLRAYGLERLVERGEIDCVQANHAAWMVEQAERADHAFHGPDQGYWLRWAEREHDNVRAALAWMLERGQAGLAVRLAAALSWSWLVHQRWREGLEWAQRILTVAPPAPSRARAMLLLHAIELSIFRGDITSNRPSGELAAVRDSLTDALALGQTLGDDEVMLGAYGMIGLFQELGVTLEGLPQVSREEIQELAQRIGHRWGECRGLEEMARHALRAGHLDAAAGALREAVSLARSEGDTWSLAMALNQLGDVERARRAHPRARALYEESLTLFDELGLGTQPNLVHNLGYVALAAGDWAEAAARFAEALNQFRRVGEGRGVAESLLGFAAVAAADGRVTDAAKLYGAGEAALEALGAELWASNRPDYERWLQRIQTGRTARYLNHARTEGRELPIEQAIALALQPTTEETAEPPTVQHWASQLTRREEEVARLAAQGLTNRQIAADLLISEKTVANHLQRVLDKLDVHSRTQLAARAAEFGLRPSGSISSTPEVAR